MVKKVIFVDKGVYKLVIEIDDVAKIDAVKKAKNKESKKKKKSGD